MVFGKEVIRITWCFSLFRHTLCCSHTCQRDVLWYEIRAEKGAFFDVVFVGTFPDNVLYSWARVVDVG